MQQQTPADLDSNEAPQGFIVVIKNDVATDSIGNICRASDWRRRKLTPTALLTGTPRSAEIGVKNKGPEIVRASA